MRSAGHACDACDGTGWAVRGCVYDRTNACPVCLGEGRISDQMPARDALADAETLRLNQRTGRAGYETWAAGSWGLHFQQNGWLGAVELAAHAAFRAVPGLRGE